MSFHVGQRVVCVDDRGGKYAAPDLPPLRKGNIYTIRAVTVEFDVPAVQVEERWRPNYWFNASRFRPVQPRKTDISVFTAMLHDQRQKVSA